ncbi:MAG: DUF5107 domain-containing protein, partial [Anaerolineae bacterium]|nr:DUF5107 domain-containing protein [Anaerolineae bacterium]
PTHPYSPCLREAWDGPYRYHRMDWSCYPSSPVSVPFTYTLLVMENDDLRVTVLPELGGRVYQMVYKATGSNELYQNPVIKPTHWGPPNQGWWLAVGGIEWGLPVDEHGYEWGEPWAWTVVTTTAGITVTVRDTDAPDRIRAAVDLFLPADRGFLAVTPHLENPTSSALHYKFWINGMLAPGPANTVGPDLRFIFNAPEMAVHSTGDNVHFPSCAGWTHTGPDCRFPWPAHQGVDFSRLGNWYRYLGFFEYPQAAANFFGVYDTAAREGVARVFPSGVVRGAKGVAVGWSGPIDPSNWTDDGSTYAEQHGGVMPAFWDEATLPPGQTLSWTEYWYPVGDIGGPFSDATAEAALRVVGGDGVLQVGVHSTAPRAAGESRLRVWETATCTPVARLDLPEVDPAHPFTATLPLGGRTPEQIAVAYVDARENVLAGRRPANCAAFPTARVAPLPPYGTAATFAVSWLEPDPWWGPATFQVQVRDGPNGPWTDWLTETQAVSATFTGAHGHTYFFRARTLERGEAFTGGDEGQAFTSVLLEPAPVLVTSRKTATWSPGVVLSNSMPIATDVLFYRVVLSNTGNLTATAVVTDIPFWGTRVLTETLAADSGPPPVYEGGQIHWSGEVGPGEERWIRYAVVPTDALQYGDRITNTVEIGGSVLGPFVRQVVTVRPWRCYLPLVRRGG